MLEKIPDTFSKKKESKTAKLFKLIADEMESLKDTLETIQSYRDIDQAQGQALDRIGDNVNEQRRGNNDFDYRTFIKTNIIANRSKGDIETINEVLSVLMGDSYLGLRELWNDERYDNEDAAIAIRMRNLDDLIEYKQEHETEPWYLDGSYLFDGTKKLNGGAIYDVSIEDYERIQRAAERIVAAGIKVYWEVPEWVINEVVITHSVEFKNRIKHEATSGSLLLNGKFELNGEYDLDRDMMITNNVEYGGV